MYNKQLNHFQNYKDTYLLVLASSLTTYQSSMVMVIDANFLITWSSNP
jgi:hypothetical protein